MEMGGWDGWDAMMGERARERLTEWVLEGREREEKREGEPTRVLYSFYCIVG